MLFLSQDNAIAAQCRQIVEEELQRETLSIVGWRKVPTNTDILGSIALSSLPSIEQILSMHLPDGVLMILSAAYLSLVAELKNVLPIMIFIFCSLSNFSDCL